MPTWYLSKLVFKIETQSTAIAQFDEQWRLFQAASYSEARAKAFDFGHSHQDHGDLPNRRSHWRFVTVSELFEMGSELRDGTELFSRVEVPDNVEHYMHSVMAQRTQVESRTEPIHYAFT